MESRKKEPITTARVRVSCHERRGPRNQVTQLSLESNQPDVEQEEQDFKRNVSHKLRDYHMCLNVVKGHIFIRILEEPVIQGGKLSK